MSLSAEQKKTIIADMNKACLDDTKTQWTNIADTIQTAMDTINNQNVFQNALNSGKITADQYANVIGVQNDNANKLAQAAKINADIGGFKNAWNTGAIKNYSDYKMAMDYENQLLQTSACRQLL